MPNGARDGKIGAVMALLSAIGFGLVSRFKTSLPAEAVEFLYIVLLILFAWGVANLVWQVDKRLPSLAKVAFLLAMICTAAVFVVNGDFFLSIVCGAAAVIAAASIIYRRRSKAD